MMLPVLGIFVRKSACALRQAEHRMKAVLKHEQRFFYNFAHIFTLQHKDSTN